MSLSGKLRKISHKETGIRDFCLQTIRFKKLLENARGVLDLFADGREKVQGEYIFDRHYVVSLIDSVLDRLGMMVYDAGVLVPASGEALYAVYDRHKLAARRLIDMSAAGLAESAAAGGSGSGDPEYQLLADVLQWFHGADMPDDKTVLGFIKQTFFYVFQGISPGEVMKNENLFEKKGLAATDAGIYVVDLWQDGLSLPEKKRALADVNSTPLRHLLMDAGGRIPAGPVWVAAVSEYQLSLQSLKPDCRFRLETLASGYEPSDFVFVFTDRKTILDKILPRGFHIEDTDYGQFAWSLDMSATTIEDTLMIIGRNLFDEMVWRVQ
jgi:hypothetical protein